MVRLALEEVDPLLMGLVGSASRPTKTPACLKQCTFINDQTSSAEMDRLTACVPYNTQRLEIHPSSSNMLRDRGPNMIGCRRQVLKARGRSYKQSTVFLGSPMSDLAFH